MNNAFELILERLEELKNHYHKCCLCDYNDGAEASLIEAMSIVRKVAEENDVKHTNEDRIRLIDAYKLRREACTCIETTDAFQQLIDEQPTYYNVYKVEE